MKFVDVKNDVAFRKIFGNEHKSQILISFLNAVLGLEKNKLITKVEIKNPYQLPQIRMLKNTILDLLVTDERNINYIVEMQIEEPNGFDKRVLYYTAKQYSSQLKVGIDYPKLNQVIFIGILNFNFFKGKDYLSKHLIINTKTGEQELKDIEFNFIELKKFNKNEKELETMIEKWVYFLKNTQNLEIIPKNIVEPELQEAYEDAKKFNWSEDELDAYINAQIYLQDKIGIMELKIKRAEEKGHQKGMEKGMEKVAKKLINKGFENYIIKEITSLSFVDIERLRK